MTVRQASAVAVRGRALLIEGSAGAGKSSLALALIDRGATLIGDDGVTLRRDGAALLAAPPPRTRGLVEARGLGLVTLPVAEHAPVALIVALVDRAPRFVDAAERVELLGVAVPRVALTARDPLLALKAELALAKYGLAPA